MIALACNGYAFDDRQVKNMYQAFLLTVLLTASLNDLVVQKAVAIDCYFCGDSECADPFNKTASDVQVRNSTTNWCGVSIRTDHRLYLNACVYVYLEEWCQGMKGISHLASMFVFGSAGARVHV